MLYIRLYCNPTRVKINRDDYKSQLDQINDILFNGCYGGFEVENLEQLKDRIHEIKLGSVDKDDIESKWLHDEVFPMLLDEAKKLENTGIFYA